MPVPDCPQDHGVRQLGMMQLAGYADARMSGGRLNIIGLTEAIFGFLWGVLICDHGQS